MPSATAIAKPLPMKNGQRMSKREAYCKRCTAKRCIHYPRWTPKQVVRLGPRIGK